MFTWINDLFENEPVAVQAVVTAAIALVTAFGFHLSGEQIGAIMAFVAAVLALFTRRKVTPTAKL